MGCAVTSTIYSRNTRATGRSISSTPSRPLSQVPTPLRRRVTLRAGDTLKGRVLLLYQMGPSVCTSNASPMVLNADAPCIVGSQTASIAGSTSTPIRRICIPGRRIRLFPAGCRVSCGTGRCSSSGSPCQSCVAIQFHSCSQYKSVHPAVRPAHIHTNPTSVITA